MPFPISDFTVISVFTPLLENYKSQLEIFRQLPELKFDRLYSRNAVAEIENFQDNLQVVFKYLKPVVEHREDYLTEFHNILILKFPYSFRQCLREPGIATEVCFEFYLTKLKAFFDYIKSEIIKGGLQIEKLILRPYERRSFVEIFSRDEIGDRYCDIKKLFEDLIPFQYHLSDIDPILAKKDLLSKTITVNKIYKFTEGCSDNVREKLVLFIVNNLSDEALFKFRSKSKVQSRDDVYIDIPSDILTFKNLLSFLKLEESTILLNLPLSSEKKVKPKQIFQIDEHLDNYIENNNIIAVPDLSNIFKIGSLSTQFFIQN